MHIHFKTSLCRKCPYDVYVSCDYKSAIKHTLSGLLPGMHFSHKCALYHKLFQPGQLVAIDLYNQIREDADKWCWVLAHKNALGTIVGTHFEFFVIELQEMVFLSRRSERHGGVEVVKPFFTYKKAAKGIRLLPGFTGFSGEHALLAGSREGLSCN